MIFSFGGGGEGIGFWGEWGGFFGGAVVVLDKGREVGWNN